MSRTSKVRLNSIRTFMIATAQNSLLRNLVISAAVIVALWAVMVNVVYAGKPLTPVSAVKSPIPQPITVVLECEEGWGNPWCTPTAESTSHRRLTTYFYIDGRYRGAANKTYDTVCSRYALRDGVHTARVYAVDTRGNTSSVGPYKVIHCDRFGPAVSTSLWYGRSWKVNLVPYAHDAGSGIDTKSFLVDNTPVTWQSYSNACTQLSLSKGWHKTKVTATDKVGHTVTGGVRTFHCP